MRLSLFKLPGHRVFKHVPIYYNEEQEKQKERERNARAELGLPVEENTTGFSARIKGRMRQRKQTPFSVAYSERRKSNLRLVFIVLVLMAVAFYFINSSKEWLELIAK
jgi:hypothetical protein